MDDKRGLARRMLLLAGGALLPQALLAGRANAQAHRPSAHKAAPPSATGNPKPDAPVGTPANTPLGPLDVLAKWAVVLDFNTGATLLDKDADTAVPPSSMTKLMTAYIVYSMLKQGRLKLDQELPVSEKAWRMGGSKMFVPLGAQVRVEDLIRGMIVQSGNDACIVLAEAIAGSEEQFVELMNAQAKRMGLRATNFVDVTGWPDPNHTMSVRDIATVAGNLIRDFPEYYHYDSEKTFRFNNIEQGNRNTLVQKGIADGLKTGHTEAGGYGLVASAMRGGRRVIVVVNGLPTMKARTEEGERLLEWAFREFEDVTLFTAGETVDQAQIWLGAAPDVKLVSAKDLTVTMPRNWRRNAKVQVQYNSPISAPVRKGDVLGKLTVSGQGVPNVDLPLLAGADVGRMPLPQRGLAVLTHFVTGS